MAHTPAFGLGQSLAPIPISGHGVLLIPSSVSLCVVGCKCKGIVSAVPQLMPLRARHKHHIWRSLFGNDRCDPQTSERLDHLCLYLRCPAPEVLRIRARNFRHDCRSEQACPLNAESPTNPRHSVSRHNPQISQVLRHLPLIVGPPSDTLDQMAGS